MKWNTIKKVKLANNKSLKVAGWILCILWQKLQGTYFAVQQTQNVNSALHGM